MMVIAVGAVPPTGGKAKAAPAKAAPAKAAPAKAPPAKAPASTSPVMGHLTSGIQTCLDTATAKHAASRTAITAACAKGQSLWGCHQAVTDWTKNPTDFDLCADVENLEWNNVFAPLGDKRSHHFTWAIGRHCVRTAYPTADKLKAYDKAFEDGTPLLNELKNGSFLACSAEGKKQLITYLQYRYPANKDEIKKAIDGATPTPPPAVKKPDGSASQFGAGVAMVMGLALL